ncbi:hypothetical protein SV7mr_35260 [Stieleria bergensis]|uniref:Uncharacterized protein n=1 Tax=Stieleria bergensis TaxID=2528025 RepID=A0A517SXW5_9BACT|nr:hypothetical protein SV7mr_35260 [Planctomycetes bacterium SV_7m_r]
MDWPQTISKALAEKSGGVKNTVGPPVGTVQCGLDDTNMTKVPWRGQAHPKERVGQSPHPPCLATERHLAQKAPTKFHPECPRRQDWCGKLGRQNRSR